jgi:hypothetical protein
MTDPKQRHGEAKPQLHLIPPAGNDEQALALALGAKKYGPRNWLRAKVELLTYLSAAKRHIDKVLDGVDIDKESGAHHLGHVMAGCSIILDARRHGMLIDNRILPSCKPPTNKRRRSTPTTKTFKRTCSRTS